MSGVHGFKGKGRALGLMIVLLVGLQLIGVAPAQAAVSLGHTVVNRTNGYDYAPAVIQEGNLRRFWWCGTGTDSAGKNTDVIYYRTLRTDTNVWSSIQKVLTPTGKPADWDGTHICDPTVVTGSFVNPANNVTYTMAMYYTAPTSRETGCGTSLNAIGVAYSNDGVNWRTAEQYNPIIRSRWVRPSGWTGCPPYGAGQAAAYKTNSTAGVRLFHTDTTQTEGTTIWTRTATNGRSFSSPSRVTTTNLPSNQWHNSDFAYDYNAGQWYAAVRLSGRPGDRESYRFRIYRLSGSITGGTWSQFGSEVNTNTTGYHLNHSPGLLKDGFGNITPHLPGGVKVYFSPSTSCCQVNDWFIRLATVT